jgi:hypothetical protein
MFEVRGQIGYNIKNDEIHDNVLRMQFEWETQRDALATVRRLMHGETSVKTSINVCYRDLCPHRPNIPQKAGMFLRSAVCCLNYCQ